MEGLLRRVARFSAALPLPYMAPMAGAFLLTAAAPAGKYAPWALAAVSAAGCGWRGLTAAAGAILGALAFLDFQAGLRHGAAAVLIFCAGTAFCTSRLWQQPWFRPLAAVGCTALVQFPYLHGRGGHQWALLGASLALLYGCAALWQEDERRQEGLFCLLLGGCGTVAAVVVGGFSPAVAAGGALALVWGRGRPLAEQMALGALAGLTIDLCGGGEVYAAAVLAAASIGGGLLREKGKVPAAAAFCVCGLWGAWLMGETTLLPLGCELATSCLVWLPVREEEAPSAEIRPDSAPAAAFQAVYDSLPQTPPLFRPENPAVLFDRAAEQVCRDCPLRLDCWQSHYSDTYNAFNDACPALLHRGRPLPEDFPPYFAARCVRFGRLLTALEGQTRDYLLRRAGHARLDAAYRLAREQYRQVSQALSPEKRTDSTSRYVCRVYGETKPRAGETVCGDTTACFAVGERTYLLLSDGMGSGEGAHGESAMTARLLRQFLTAGIDPLPALKTLNTALTLRCQSGGGFTTIDLVCIDGVTGTATLYKYGAPPTYLKKGGAVTVLAADTLPAGLEGDSRDTPPKQASLTAGCWLVLVSDGVTASGDEWLQDLLAGWEGTSPRALTGEILREAQLRSGGGDDCAVIAAKVERCGGKTRV